MIANEISNKNNQPKPINLSKNMFEHSITQNTVTAQNQEDKTQNMKNQVRQRKHIPFS